MLLFLFWLGFSIAVAIFADTHGRSGIGWFFLSLLLSPLLGFIFIAVLPNLKNERAKSTELAESKVCPQCAERVKVAALVCRFCGFEFPSIPVTALATTTVAPASSTTYEQFASEPEKRNPPAFVIVAFFVVVGLMIAISANLPGESKSQRTPQVATASDLDKQFGGITGSADDLSTAAPPDSFRGMKWNSKLPPTSRLLRTAMKGCTSITVQEGFNATAPCSRVHIDTDDIELFDQRENVPPFYGVTVSEQMFTWSYKKLWSGQIILKNESDLSKLRQRLIAQYGQPTFENPSLRITKWKWGSLDQKLSMQLFVDNHNVVSFSVSQEE